MKKHSNLVKSAAVLNVLALAASAAGCSGTASSAAKTVDADSPWFDAQEISVAAEYFDNSDDYDYLIADCKASTADDFVIAIDAEEKIPEEAYNDPDFNWYEYSKMILQEYDYDGNLIGEILPSDLLGTEASVNIEAVYSNGDCYYAEISAMDLDTYETVNYVAVLDFENPGACTVTEEETDSSLQDMSLEKTLVVNGKLIKDYWVCGDGGEDASYVITLTDIETNETTVIDLRDDYGDYTFWNVDSNIQVSETEVLVLISSDDGGAPVEMMLDTEAETIELLEEDDWFTAAGIDTYDISSTADGQVFAVTNTGIKSLDMENKTVEDFFSYDSTYINSNDLYGMSVMYADTETGELKLCGNVTDYSSYDPNIGYDSQFKVIRFTRAETNPNAGKTIITVASVGDVGNSLSGAISEFNSTNENYFISLVDTYDISKFIDSDAYDNVQSIDDYSTLVSQASSEMSNQLSMDIMCGTGPDIILDASSMTQLDTEDYLVDLSDYLTDTSAYYGSIIEASKVDGHLYQIPLSFSIAGIMTSTENVSEGQTGFTFEQYVDFVDEVCNGTDPMAESGAGRITYFNECFGAMYDQFYTDGNISLDNDAFTALAEYVRDHVSDSTEADNSEDEDYFTESSSEQTDAKYTTIYSAYNYLNSLGSIEAENVGIYGIPSVDGRGPMAQINNSAAISTSCADREGAWQFIEMLLSEKYQEFYATNASPISRSALEASCADAVATYNEGVEENLRYSTEAELASFGMAYRTMDEDALDEYYSCIDSITNVGQADTSILSIISEEIPAFYEGQKSIEEVVAIIEDRAQTVIDERA